GDLAVPTGVEPGRQVREDIVRQDEARLRRQTEAGRGEETDREDRRTRRQKAAERSAQNRPRADGLARAPEPGGGVRRRIEGLAGQEKRKGAVEGDDRRADGDYPAEDHLAQTSDQGDPDRQRREPQGRVICETNPAWRGLRRRRLTAHWTCSLLIAERAWS